MLATTTFEGRIATLTFVKTAATPTTTPATRWLNHAEMRAWRNYLESFAELMTAFEADLAPFGLTMGDYEVLVRLSEAPDRGLRMCDLAEALRLSPSGLTRRLDGLVRAGQVERKSCAADRRVAFAHLTDEGMRQLVIAAPAHVASVRRHLIDPLTKVQVAALGDIFENVRTRLNATKG